VEKDMGAMIEELLETVFSILAVTWLYNKYNWTSKVVTQ
jgi:hypothetical protein